MARINSLQGRIKFPVPMRRELDRKLLYLALHSEPIAALGGPDPLGHGAHEPTGLARPLASVPCTRVGRRELCQGLPPARPPWHPAWKPSSYRPWSVGLAEIGDKTQILSLMLAGRFLRPVPIIFGILLAARRAGDERCGGAVGRTRWVKRRRFIGGEQLAAGSEP
jgi:hypothetical protein